ncbi:MAG: putative sensor protein [Frankiales bacterium]|nr:putative sensor protein [Frankiales bacterium]
MQSGTDDVLGQEARPVRVPTPSPARSSRPGGAEQAALRLLAAGTANPGLDRLVGLAARLLAATSAQVSLLTSVQTVAAAHGLPTGTVGSTGPLDQSLCTVTASLGAPLVVSDSLADTRVNHLPPVTSGALGSYLGVPLRTASADTVGALCVFGPEPRTWSEADVSLLEELSRAVMAELELSALATEYESSRLRWETALEAAGIGSFDWDLTSERVDWDDRLQALFGFSPGEHLPLRALAFARIHPDDRPAMDHAISGAIASRGQYHAEFRVAQPDGGERWIAARGRVMTDAQGTPERLVGTCHDVTELRSARDRAASLLESMATGFLSVDTEWRVTYLNASGAMVVGYTAPELVGRDLWDAFPGLDTSDFGRHYQQAVALGEPVEFEAYYDHLPAWFEVRAVPSAEGLNLYFLDITARRADQERARVAQSQAEAAVARLELLSQVSAELTASSLQSAEAVQRLAELVVPQLGDWSVVTLMDDDGVVRETGSWHVDPELRPVVQDYVAHRFDGIEPYSFVTVARDTGEPVILPDEAGQRAAAEIVSPSALAALSRLAVQSAVVLPLFARGHATATLSLGRGRGRSAMSAEEMTLAQEVASRAGLALDNARLFAQQRSLAEALQRSLLTEPPEPDHGEIVVRYVPAAEAASVGGDWFDSFIQPDGATTLVIGDVVGHDTEAAAAMGQVRSLLRGIAWDTGAAPASVLRRLDAALEGLQVQTTASAVVGRLEQTLDERLRGITRWRWSNAGHPPPMVVNPDGSVTVLTELSPNLLLGIDPATPRGQSEVILDRGSTVLLYTDGLVERRGEDLDVGLNRLRDTLADLASQDLTLNQMCDGLLHRLTGTAEEAAEDDVALIAVRLHRQDRPRPPEAGPRRVPPNLPPEPLTSPRTQ